MRSGAVAFVVGVLFALGLGLGGMLQPAKVVQFLDVFGNWDPSLAFVMGGAVAVHLVLFRLIVRRPSPLLADRFALPASRGVTPRLVIGSALFGIGWGLGGICPGPGVSALASGATPFVLFVAAMVAGMAIFQLWERGRGHRGSR